jgi:hypothetical protein
MHFLKRLIIAIRGTHARDIHQSQYFLQISSSESTISDLRKMLIHKLNFLGFQAQQLKIFRQSEGMFCLSVLLNLSADLRQSFIQMAIGLSQHQDVRHIQWGLRSNKPRLRKAV